MRYMTLLAALFLVACTPAEKEVHTTSANIDDTVVPQMFAALDALTESGIPVDALAELAASTPLDEETEQRFPVAYNGDEAEVQVHIWREQADWVHVYASSTNESLVGAIEDTMSEYARAEDD